MNQLSVPSFVDGIAPDPEIRAELCEYLAGLVADDRVGIEHRTIEDTDYLVVSGPRLVDEVEAIQLSDVPLVLESMLEDGTTGRAVHFLEVRA